MTSSPFQVLIMGRPNTGKSTLFNRLIGKRRALVHDEPGVTRDRNEAKVEWLTGPKSSRQRVPLLLVDTGGLGGERFAREIEDQVRSALRNADLVLFVFDGKAGLTPLDEELLRDLNRSGVLETSAPKSISQREPRKGKIPVLGLVNKVDADVHEERIADFFATGLDPILTLSAEHGRGMDDLKEVILSVAVERGFGQPVLEEDLEGGRRKRTVSSSSRKKSHEHGRNLSELESTDLNSSQFDSAESELPELESRELESPVLESDEQESPSPRRVPSIAIVGRPNVGKSTLFNAILGEKRTITSPIAGTTVDTVDSEVNLGGKEYLFVDTAGIRRKSKTEQGIEVLSVVQARKALDRAELALLVLDGEKGITDQDRKISSLVEEAGCSVVLILNKWDLHRRNKKFTQDVAAKRIREDMPHLKYAPILFVSALRGQGLRDLGDLIEEILTQRQVKIPTHEFTEWVREEALVHNPKNVKFFLCHQSGRNPPTFVCHVNDPDRVDFSLERHLINALRERWGYMGTPVKLVFVSKSSRG